MPNNDYTEDYYKLAKEQEFKQLLDKEIQLENAKHNALKHTENDMASLGLLNTGYGNTNQSAIFNTFLNNLTSAENQTNTNLNNLDLQKMKTDEEAANNRFNNFTALMSNTTSRDELNNLFTDYGYGKIGTDGTLDLSVKPENLSDDDWLQIKAIYRNTNSAFDERDELQKTPLAYSQGEILNLQFVNSKGEVKRLGDDENDEGFVEEAEKLMQNADNNVYKDKDAIKLINWKGETLYLMYEDGGFRTINRKEYNEAKTKRTLKGKGNKEFEEN